MLILFQGIYGKTLKIYKNNYEEILDVRGAGLLLGIKTKQNNVMISK